MTTPSPVDALAGANDSLVQARRLALMGQIAAGASHDLNNLLGKIIGLAELTMDEVADRPDACAELEALISVAEQGARVVGRLEACSGRSIAEPRRFDLAALVDAGCVAAEAQRPDLAFVREIPGGPLWVLADDSLLRVALDAVLDNASRWGASQTGVQCRILSDIAGDRQAEVVVQDDGAGMATEVLARAFEPFFTTRSSEAPAGVGLSLARAALSECGGRIEIDSSPGAGTMVRLSLPIDVELYSNAADSTPGRRSFGAPG